MRTALRRSGTSPIETTVAGLNARLPRPTAGRRGILLEVRDGLEDAADAYRATGLDRFDAERRAVSDFGDLDRVAADFVAVRAVRSGTLAALFLGPGYVLVLAAWTVLMLAGPDGRSAPANPLATVYTWLGIAAVATSAAGAIGLRVQAVRNGSPRRWTALLGISGLLAGTTALLVSYAISPWSLRLAGGALSWHQGTELFSGLMAAAMLTASVRALLSARACRSTGGDARSLKLGPR